MVDGLDFSNNPKRQCQSVGTCLGFGGFCVVATGSISLEGYLQVTPSRSCAPQLVNQHGLDVLRRMLWILTTPAVWTKCYCADTG
jgi:hypothetical protein